MLWTPAGYFDAAVGAEDLLGWHISRRAPTHGPTSSPCARCARLHRPDVLDRLFESLDGEQADLANAAGNRPQEAPLVLADALPPVIDAVGAPDLKGSDAGVRVRVRLRSPQDAPVTALVARADGRPARVDGNGTASASVEVDLQVRFEGQPNSIALVAENKWGRSMPATFTLNWNAPRPTAAESPPASAVAVRPADAGTSPATVAAPSPPRPAATGAATDPDRKPRLYVLAVGVGKFADDSISPLDLTSKDVRDFVAEIRKQQGRLYRQVDVKLLVDQGATRDAIMDGLEWLQRQVTQHDVGMLFVAGHGDNDADLGYIYVPHNFNAEAKRRTAVSFKEFSKTLDALAGKALFFIDTCHSGNVLGQKSRSVARNPDASGAINDLISAESGVVVFSASTGRQYALENRAWGNGAFTKALVEGLSGKADLRGKGQVTHKMLDFYISDRVKELTKGKQTPVTQAPGGVPDFPLALVR
ncbi:MAG: caspase family protein [Rubrivivax sp.]